MLFLNLEFVSPCIIKHSNKSTNQMHQSLRFIACSLNTAQHVSGHPHAHHQELINCSSRLWFTVGGWWQQCCWSWSGRPARPWPTALLPPRFNGKPEAATAVDKLLMMGMRMPETCWAVFKLQAINLRDWCIWLVDLFEWTNVIVPVYHTLTA